ncbi:MAG: DUF4369 domain-containing protein [Bacteroidota bacterium]
MKQLLSILCLGLFCAACSKVDKHTMYLSGTVDGLKKGTLFLQQIADSSLITLDSLEIRGSGDFTFEVPMKTPQLCYLYLEKADNNDINDRLSFFGEKGNISIRTSWDQFDSGAEVVGSKSHQLYSEYQEMMSEFNKKDLMLAQAAIGLQDTVKIDSIEKLSKHNFVSRYRYLLHFALTNTSSYVTPFVTVIDGTAANPIYLDSIHRSLPDSIANSPYGKKLALMVGETNN